MIISRLILTNWKNFQYAEIELTDRVFVVGPNASGKSNFLDAIRFTRDIVKQAGGLQYAADVRGGVSEIRNLSGEKGKTDISLEFHLTEKAGMSAEWIYKLSFRHSEERGLKNTVNIAREKVWSKKAGTWILERSPETEGEDSETAGFTHLEQPASNKEFREIYKFFLNTEYLHIVPQLVRDADSYLLSGKKEDYYGRNFLNRMANTPARLRESYLGKISGILKIAVPNIGDLKFTKDAEGIPHLEALHKFQGPTGKLREFQFSDGTLRLIGFMWALLDGNETILLEEPELHLHTAVVRQLPELISRLQKREDRIIQVIITTHSFDLLSNEGIGADEVIVLEQGRGGTLAKHADQTERIRKYLEAGFSMAEAVVPKTAPENIGNLSILQD